MKNQPSLIIAFWLLSFLSLNGQNQQWFTYTDGRPVSAIKEHNGTYWISTFLGGLVYFTDPEHIYHLDQSNSPINTNKFSAMDMDANGGLWLGTAGGDIYSYINGQWTFYSDAKTRKHSVLRVDKIIVDHNNEVWFTRRYMDPLEEKPKTSGIIARAFGEEYELVKLEEGQFNRQEIQASSVYDMSLGIDNSLLLATNGGLKLLSNKLEEVELPEDADISQPYTVFQDGQGSYWLSSGRWTWKYIDDMWIVQKIYTSNGKKFSIPAERFDAINENEIIISGSGEAFWGNAGMWKQIDRSRLKAQFGKNVNLDYTYVTQNGELFANTRVGLLWFKEDQIIRINPSNSALRGSSIDKLYIDENNVIHFKSEGVAFKIDEDEWTTNYLDDYWWTPAFRNLPKEEQDKIGDFILKQMKTHFNDVIISRDGTIWIATGKGLVKSKNGTIQLYDQNNSDLPSNSLYGIAQAPDDALWLGLDSGVVEWRNEIMIYHALECRYAEARYKNISFHPDGRIFVSRIDGFHIYDGKKWEHIKEGLPMNRTINDMLVDMNGTLWLGTYGSGLLKYDEDGVKNITTEGTGLSSNTIFTMDVDQYNNIWLGTQEGLCVFNESGLVGQVAEEGASPYYQIQANSPYSVSTDFKGENTADLKLHFNEIEELFTQINLFPNPTSGRFTVQLKAVNDVEADYQLFNLNGQLIQQKRANGKNQRIQMNLKGYTAGTYLLRIKQGNIVVSERILKI